MCKIMIIPKVRNTKKAMQFLKASAPKMSKSDNDGLGYAAMHSNGDISIERWLNPKDAFKRRSHSLSIEAIALKPIADCLKDYSAETYSKSGPGYNSSPIKSLIYHTRFATCEKSLANVHPFVREDTVLIHNGVISNPEAFPPLQSSCDSEALLNAYVELNAANSIHGIQEISDNLQGYYAAAVFSRTNEGQVILDVIKDNRAQLYVAYIDELKSEVFCTSESILKDACKKLGWRCGEVHELIDNNFIRYNALTGEVIQSFEFARLQETARPYSTWEAMEARLPIQSGEILEDSELDIEEEDEEDLFDFDFDRKNLRMMRGAK